MLLTDKGGPAQLNLWEGNGAPGLTARGGTGLRNRIMSDRVKLAREITARTKPRFFEIKPEPRRIRKRFVETSPSRGGGTVAFTEAELTAMRGGLTIEEYLRKFIRKWR